MPIQTINDSTFKLTAKNDPKDLITVFIGDDKQEEFYPQIKLERWDNEVNFSVRLKQNIEGSIVKTKGDKITYSKGNIDVEYYPYEGGHKMVWFLKEKPASNKVEFSLQSKGLDFFYQPELTQKEIDEGAFRPENVVGSYAVYHKTKGGMNDINGMAYKTGKFAHIYRPHLYDAEGKETWGILHIENGIYSVEIPQDFLDKAVYPIRSNDTFGYETQGGTVSENMQHYARGSLFAGVAGTGVSMSAYINNNANNDVARFGVAIHSNGNLLTNGSTNLSGTLTSGTHLYTLNFTSAPTFTAIDYILVAVATYHAYPHLAYDTGGVNQGHKGSTIYGEDCTIANDTYSTHTTNKYSIYATYTPAGGDDYVMSVTVGAFTLTGIAAILTRALNMACSVGEFTLTGIDVALKRGYTLAAAVGEFTLTGIAAIFTKALNMGVSVGEFTLTGIATTFTKALNMAVAVGSFTLTGIAAILTRGYTIVADVGEFTLTGIATTFTRALNMAVSVGEFTLTGIDAIITSARSMAVAVGSFTLTGIDTIFTKALTMAVSVGEFTLTGIATTFTRALNMVATVGEFTLTGIAAGLKRGYTIVADVGEFALTGIAAGLKRGYTLATSVGEFTLTGIATTFTKALNMAVNVGEFVLTGIDVTLTAAIKEGYEMIAGVGRFILTGIDAVLKAPIHWTNATKHDATIINATKHDVSVVNATKHDATIINIDKSNT